VSHYDGDAWTYHVPNEVKCAECSEYFDDQEREGNICPPCVAKGYEGKDNLPFCGDHIQPIRECRCLL
jgi:hypothetical protein